MCIRDSLSLSGEIQDAQGDGIALYSYPSAELKFSKNFTLNKISMPQDQAQTLVASFQANNGSRAVVLDVIGNINEVRLQEQRYRPGNYTAKLTYVPQSVRIKSRSDDGFTHEFTIK